MPKRRFYDDCEWCTLNVSPRTTGEMASPTQRRTASLSGVPRCSGEYRSRSPWRRCGVCRRLHVEVVKTHTRVEYSGGCVRRQSVWCDVRLARDERRWMSSRKSSVERTCFLLSREDPFPSRSSLLHSASACLKNKVQQAESPSKLNPKTLNLGCNSVSPLARPRWNTAL